MFFAQYHSFFRCFDVNELLVKSRPDVDADADVSRRWHNVDGFDFPSRLKSGGMSGGGDDDDCDGGDARRA